MYVFDKTGRQTRAWWFKSPVVSMMHDMAITDRHIILPTTGMTTSLERLKRGEIHWGYDPNDARARRDHSARWRREGHPLVQGHAAAGMMVHTTNARTEGSKVILDAPCAGGNFHPYFPSIDGSPYDTPGATCRRSAAGPSISIPKSDTWQEEILFDGRKVTIVRSHGRPLSHAPVPLQLHDADGPVPAVSTPSASAICRPAYRICGCVSITHTGETTQLFAGAVSGFSEPQFIPAPQDAPEGDGYLIGAVNNFEEMRSDIAIVDAMRLEEGPIARIKLPFRLHTQVHGWWASAEDLPF